MKHIKKYEGFIDNLKSIFKKEEDEKVIDIESLSQSINDALLEINDIGFETTVNNRTSNLNVRKSGEVSFGTDYNVFNIHIEKRGDEFFKIDDVKETLLFIIDLIKYQTNNITYKIGMSVPDKKASNYSDVDSPWVNHLNNVLKSTTMTLYSDDIETVRKDLDISDINFTIKLNKQ